MAKTPTAPDADTTAADTAAEQARQDAIAAAMAHCWAVELPELGGDTANDAPPWAVPA